MPKSKTKLNLEEEKKKEMGENLDYLKQIENAPGAEAERKIVIDELKEKERVEKNTRDTVASVLQSSQQSRFTYKERLSGYGQAGLEAIEWPEGWERYCLATSGQHITIYGRSYETKDGILIIVKSANGDVYVRGVLCAYDPEVDMKAIDILILQAENTLDSSKGLLLSDNRDTVSGLRKTKGGIILPD